MANFIDFEKVIIHNFGSYGHAELDLKSKGFCLVSGKNNFKKDNALSNGSGKSFIWSAICYTITGETLNGLHTDLKNINIEDDDSIELMEKWNIKSIPTIIILSKDDELIARFNGIVSTDELKKVIDGGE